MQRVKAALNNLTKNRGAMTQYLAFVSTVLLSIFFYVMNPNFLKARNIINILRDISPIMILACGEALILMMGSIDLSIGSIASCAAVMLTVLLEKFGVWAYVVVLLYGAFAGTFNGVLHTKLGIPSFIATLCSQAIWQSAAYLISGGQPLTMMPPVWPLVNWAKVSYFSAIPLLFLVALAVLVIYSMISKYTKTGRTVLAVGANERASWLMGQNVRRAKMLAFFLSGLGGAIGGIFFAVKLKSGIPTVGAQYLMPAIASAVLGGVAMTGGKGILIFTLLGSLLITIIQNGMNVIGVDGLWQQVIFGSLLMAAIYMNSNKNYRNLVVK